MRMTTIAAAEAPILVASLRCSAAEDHVQHRRPEQPAEVGPGGPQQPRTEDEDEQGGALLAIDEEGHGG